jgi:uncharacterized protein YccT (UPF0319 family)
MKKNFFVLFAVLLSMTLQAAAPWDGTTIATTYAGGTGTLIDPYQISTPAELAFLSQSVNGGTNYFNNYFILTSDLDLASKSWTPIGNSTTAFRGTFDGNSHLISNLNVNVATSNAGLFGVAQYAKIKNVGIVGTSTVTGAGSVGAIVGLVTGAGATAFSMSGCFSNATVSSGSGSNAGGIVGYFNNTTGVTALSLITNCYSTGNISGASYVAGIVGRANATTGTAGGLTISNSYATGTITAPTGTNGIAKITGTTITVTNCFYIYGYLQTGATVKTAAQMQDPAFLTLINNSQSPSPWIADFTGGNSFNNGFPILSWSTQTILPDAPTGIIASRGNAQVTVTFATSAVLDYTVTPYIGATAGTPVTGSSSPIVVTGLTNGTAYTFKVTARNVLGTSASATSSAVTPATVPNAPTSVIGTAGNAQVSVAFTAPVDNGGSAILDYTVTPYIGTTAGTPVTGSGSPIVVTGLINGTAYTFTVTARNVVGSSAASSASSAVTPDGTTNITSTLISNGKVTVIGKTVKFEAPVSIINMELYNFSGKLVGSKNINYAARQVSFDVEQAGIYLLIAHTAEGQLTQKIIIK